MNKTQAGRLLTLAWFLRTEVPKEHFRMQSFMTSTASNFNYQIEDLLKPECGTTACAMGWATVVFPDAYRIVEGIPVPRDPDVDECDFDVDFWGLDDYENDWPRLFGMEYDRTPKQEAAVLERFALKHGWTYAD